MMSIPRLAFAAVVDSRCHLQEFLHYMDVPTTMEHLPGGYEQNKVWCKFRTAGIGGSGGVRPPLGSMPKSRSLLYLRKSFSIFGFFSNDDLNCGLGIERVFLVRRCSGSKNLYCSMISIYRISSHCTCGLKSVSILSVPLTMVRFKVDACAMPTIFNGSMKIPSPTTKSIVFRNRPNCTDHQWSAIVVICSNIGIYYAISSQITRLSLSLSKYILVYLYLSWSESCNNTQWLQGHQFPTHGFHLELCYSWESYT